MWNGGYEYVIQEPFKPLKVSFQPISSVVLEGKPDKVTQRKCQNGGSKTAIYTYMYNTDEDRQKVKSNRNMQGLHQLTKHNHFLAPAFA